MKFGSEGTYNLEVTNCDLKFSISASTATDCTGAKACAGYLPNTMATYAFLTIWRRT